MAGGIKMNKKKNKPLLNAQTCIRLKPTSLEKIEKIAEIKQRKVSELMRMVLESYIEQFDENMLTK